MYQLLLSLLSPIELRMKPQSSSKDQENVRTAGRRYLLASSPPHNLSLLCSYLTTYYLLPLL